MNPSLREETERLARSWDRHDAVVLRDYLVAEVEDPRVNLQSIFNRHFLLWNLFSGQFSELMEAEYTFSGIANGLSRMAGAWSEPDEAASVLHALRKGADNAEGQELPHYLLRAYAELPKACGIVQVPNYIEQFLQHAAAGEAATDVWQKLARTFEVLWRDVLARRAGEPEKRSLPSVIEPACGSANDFRFLDSYGLAQSIDYTGMDLCEKNVANALQLFPSVSFRRGNVFDIEAADCAYDLCFVHDLLEHLSLPGMECAVAELCRVTRSGLCIHFFNMDETPDHSIRPVDEYHWNLLSMDRTRELFASHGFTGQVFHAASFLRERGKCEGYHNPNSYSFILSRG